MKITITCENCGKEKVRVVAWYYQMIDHPSCGLKCKVIIARKLRYARNRKDLKQCKVPMKEIALHA